MSTYVDKIVVATRHAQYYSKKKGFKHQRIKEGRIYRVKLETINSYKGKRHHWDKDIFKELNVVDKVIAYNKGSIYKLP